MHVHAAATPVAPTTNSSTSAQIQPHGCARSVLDGRDGREGPPGLQGPPGRDGRDGLTGAQGPPRGNLVQVKGSRENRESKGREE